ncbi:MAG: ribosome recycling factor [Salinisphaera sp.]|nr:ribosome recycling factor [Salinisphaera sp.]MDN5937648.1 ribosome recycling factor [Salinisphaera sp.]
MIDDILADTSARMDKSIVAVNEAFTKIRTGRAHSSLLDHLEVDYYGAKVPLNQAANVNVEDARTISISPWEKAMVPVVEKAIMTSDLGLNPSTAGTVIRVVIPPLTEERRRDLVRILRKEAEEGRVAVRNIRRDANSDCKELVNEKEISEDDARRAETRIQALTDEHTARIDSLLEAKEQEVMTV